MATPWLAVLVVVLLVARGKNNDTSTGTAAGTLPHNFPGGCPLSWHTWMAMVSLTLREALTS